MRNKGFGRSQTVGSAELQTGIMGHIKPLPIFPVDLSDTTAYSQDFSLP